MKDGVLYATGIINNPLRTHMIVRQLNKLLFLILISFSVHSFAEWMKMMETDKNTYYLNPDKLRLTEVGVNVWTLVDRQEPSNHPSGMKVLSVMTNYDFDCKRYQMRQVAMYFFNDNMGKGQALRAEASFLESDWHPPAPGRYLEFVLNTNCEGANKLKEALKNK